MKDVNYWKAVGYILSMKAGVKPSSLRWSKNESRNP
jgi:hypothetical protein